jgi:hypothetical protein
MPSIIEAENTRFQLGDFVRIRDVIMTGKAGKTGIIVACIPNRLGRRTLDRYAVRFENEEALFWDIQLVKVDKAPLS